VLSACTRTVLLASRLFPHLSCYRRSVFMRANAQLDQGWPPDAVRVAHAFCVKCHEIVCSGCHDILYSPALRSAGELCAYDALGVRRATGASSAPRSRATANRSAKGQRCLGGRSFSSVIPTRATAGFLSRRFTRAMYSPLPLTNHDSRVTNHVLKGGTLNRPSTRVTLRKQTVGHHQGRNIASHCLAPFFALARRHLLAAASRHAHENYTRSCKVSSGELQLQVRLKRLRRRP
jgi:hypothetical protein